MVISALFCIMGGSRRSRVHLSCSRGELGCAHGISAHQALPWHRGNSRAALGPGFWGTSSSPRRRNQIQPGMQGRIRAEGVLYVLIAELTLPPLGAKNTLPRHLTEVPEQSWGDSLAWGQGSGAGEGRTGTNNPLSVPTKITGCFRLDGTFKTISSQPSQHGTPSSSPGCDPVQGLAPEQRFGCRPSVSAGLGKPEPMDGSQEQN